MKAKFYDYEKAKGLIEEKKEQLESAALGMHEDWFWTANDIWNDGEYTKNLISNKEAEEMEMACYEKRKEGVSMFSDELRQFDDAFIGGIRGSDWGTPTLCLRYKNGDEEMVECSYGQHDIPLGEKIERQIQWTSGCLSSEVQANIPALKTN